MYQPKPIHSEEEYAAAMREVDALLADVPEPGTPDYEKLELLGILIYAYEREHSDHRFDERQSNPIAAIRLHLDRLRKTTKDLGSALASVSWRAVYRDLGLFRARRRGGPAVRGRRR